MAEDKETIWIEDENGNKINKAPKEILEDAAQNGDEVIFRIDLSNQSAASMAIMAQLARSIEASKSPDMLEEPVYQALKNVKETMLDYVPNDLKNEFDNILPYLEKILKQKPYSSRQLSELVADESENLFLKALKKAQLIYQQNKSRDQVRAATVAAEQNNELNVTGLWKNDRLFTPTSDDFMDAFSPNHIYYYGNLDNSKKVGRISIADEDKKELQQLNETSKYLFSLLASLQAGSEPDLYTKMVINPCKPITFSVTEMAKNLGLDPRAKGNSNQRLDQSKMIQRGREIFNMLKPLDQFVGEFNDGSLYTVLNISAYDAETDTITLMAPYVGEVLRRLQRNYKERRETIEEKRQNNKRISKRDNKPFEKNDLLKSTCRGIDNATYEIMLYITTLMIRKGTGSKKMELKYSTIISNCPTLQYKLKEIEKQSVAAKVKARNCNNEFRKFTFAWKYLLDTKYSAMTEEWTNISCSPIDKKGMLKAPTNTTINDKILIEWNTQKTT